MPVWRPIGMHGNREPRPPLVCKAIVRAASWLAPSRVRAEWRDRWDAGLWSWWVLFERGELTGRDRAELLRHSWSSFMDAFWLRISREQLRHSVRSASFVLASSAAALLLIALATGGFAGSRTIFTSRPVTDPGSLVSIRYLGAADQPYGVLPQWVPLWRAHSRELTDVAGFVYPQRTMRAWVTENFFAVLGIKPAAGRFFRAGDRDVAVMSHAAWQDMFALDPAALGRTVELDGRPHRIVGVLPKDLWVISPGVDLFTPLILEPQPGPELPRLIGAVGRMKRGGDLDRVRQELFRIAKTANQALMRPPQVRPFNGIPSGPGGYLLWICFAITIGGAAVLRGAPLPSVRSARYWAYLAAKVALLTAAATLLWLEGSVFLQRRLAEEVTVQSIAVSAWSLAFLLICAVAILWSFMDQRRRCPVCLQLLTMPVSIGSWGSVLEPATTELLCDAGHGSLCVPDSGEGAPDRWTNLDASWSSLFHSRRR